MFCIFTFTQPDVIDIPSWDENIVQNIAMLLARQDYYSKNTTWENQVSGGSIARVESLVRGGERIVCASATELRYNIQSNLSRQPSSERMFTCAAC